MRGFGGKAHFVPGFARRITAAPDHIDDRVVQERGDAALCGTFSHRICRYGKAELK